MDTTKLNTLPPPSASLGENNGFSLFDNMKSTILWRLKKNLTLEELEVLEAQQEALFKKQGKPYMP